VKVFNEIKHQLPFQQKKLFAVGSKTAQYFNELSDYIIFPAAENAEALAQLIIQHKIKKALFWCSNLRRPILPEILKQNNIEVEDLIVYETIIQTETINQHYDAIAFLSSAATDSFFNNNQVLPNVPLFAIGETTFNTLKNYSAQNVFVAEKPNTTLLLQQIKKYYSL
jgi:uroporphyrinogen-III synthase